MITKSTWQASIMTIIVMIIFGIFTYGMYWLYKTVSYSFFYENMVQQTITEMVKPEYLK